MKQLSLQRNLQKFYLLALLLVACSSHVLYQNIRLNEYQNSIEDIDILNDERKEISSSFKVTILSGSQFEKSEEYFFDSKKVKITEKGIASLSKDGSSLDFRQFSEQNITLLQNHLQSSVIVTEKYVLVGQNNQGQPTLKRVNFDELKLQTITYPAVDNWDAQSPIILANFNNGEFGFSEGLYLFIIDNQTLQIKQQIKAESVYEKIRYIYTYSDPKSNTSSIFLGKGENTNIVSQLIKDKQTQQYSTSYRFDGNDENYKFQITLTGANSAVTFQGLVKCSISYWDNLHSINDLSQDLQYFMRDRQKVAASYSEQFFVVRNSSGFYEFYDLDDNYQIELQSTIFISNSDFEKGKTTTDDKFLFVSMSNSRGKYNIAKVDINSSQFTLITDNDGNSDIFVDFNLFDTKYNRFITLSIRNKSNYYLELRSLQDLSIISEIPLQLNFTVLQIKLVGNVEWDLVFVVAARNKPYSFNLQNDTKVFLFKVEGDTIISKNISRDVGFNYLQPCNKYLVTYKQRFPTIKVIHFSNLSLAFLIDPQTQSYAKLIIQSNFLIVNSFFNYNKVYDLSKSNLPLGVFYRIYTIFLNQEILIIFPKKGILYQASTDNHFNPTFTKLVYNISSPMIKSQTIINNEGCYDPTYIIDEKSQSKCNFVFYIEYLQVYESIYTKRPQLVRYNECTKIIDKYLVAQEQSYENQDVSSIFSLYVSTDKKYISVLVKFWQRDQLQLEIRPIDSLQKVIFHKIFGYSSSKLPYLDQFHVDVVKDNIILIQSPQFLTIYFIQPKIYAQDYQMSQITCFDINKNLVAFAGPSFSADGQIIIIKQHHSSKEYIFQSQLKLAIKGITLSASNQFLAAFTQKNIFVWNISSAGLVLDKMVDNITQIKFEQGNSLRIIIGLNSYVLHLNGKMQTASKQTITQSKDLKMVAKIQNQKQVSVQTREGNIINQIFVNKDQSIQSIQFLENNHLCIITSAETMNQLKKVGKNLIVSIE